MWMLRYSTVTWALTLRKSRPVSYIYNKALLSWGRAGKYTDADVGTSNKIVSKGYSNPDSSFSYHDFVLNGTALSCNCHCIPQPPTITCIPPELHNKIFELPGPVASACVGITCRKLYAIHRSHPRQVLTIPTSEGRKRWAPPTNSPAQGMGEAWLAGWCWAWL